MWCFSRLSCRRRPSRNHSTRSDLSLHLKELRQHLESLFPREIAHMIRCFVGIPPHQNQTCVMDVIDVSDVSDVSGVSKVSEVSEVLDVMACDFLAPEEVLILRRTEVCIFNWSTGTSHTVIASADAGVPSLEHAREFGFFVGAQRSRSIQIIVTKVKAATDEHKDDVYVDVLQCDINARKLTLLHENMVYRRRCWPLICAQPQPQPCSQRQRHTSLVSLFHGNCHWPLDDVCALCEAALVAHAPLSSTSRWKLHIENGMIRVASLDKSLRYFLVTNTQEGQWLVVDREERQATFMRTYDHAHLVAQMEPDLFLVLQKRCLNLVRVSFPSMCFLKWRPVINNVAYAKVLTSELVYVYVQQLPETSTCGYLLNITTNQKFHVPGSPWRTSDRLTQRGNAIFRLGDCDSRSHRHSSHRRRELEIYVFPDSDTA